MSTPLIANIVNATIGGTSVMFHLWHYFRRGRNVESLWAMLISFSATVYALTMFRLYQGLPQALLRSYFNFLYLMIALFFWGLLGYAAARIQFDWKTKWRWLAALSALAWVSLIFFSPVLLNAPVIHISLSSTQTDFAQIKPGLGISLFYIFHSSLALAALYMVNRHRFSWHTRPLYFNIALGVFVVAAAHDVLAIHQMINVRFFWSEYSIALVSLVMFINSQEDSASLVDSQQLNLLNSQHDFIALMQSSRDIIAVHRDNRFVFINQAGVVYLGYKNADEILGREVMQFVHPDDRARVAQRIASLNSQQNSLPIQRELLLHKNGQALPSEISATQVMFNGQTSTLVIARDLGERIEFETRMMQMDRMVAIGTLAAGVAHEINNPLTFVVGNLELMQDDLKQLKTSIDATATAQQQSLLSELEQLTGEAADGAERIRRTVQDLSALAHDHEAADPLPVNVAKVINSAARLSKTQTKHRARLEIAIDGELFFMGDAAKMTQVFINLLVNAAQAIPLGHVDDNLIQLRAFRQDAELCIQVRDTGSGIAPEKKDKLFDPFVTNKAVGEGTGLGLAISRQIVTDHGGRIQVESQPGKGSLFSVFLPACSAPRGDARHSSTAAGSTQGAQATRHKKAHILLIDDENSVRQTLSRMLKNDAEVDSVGSVAEAVSILNQNADYDLLICDLIMPQQTGMDMYKLLLRSWPTLLDRLVFISGGAFSEEASDFIQKIDRPVLAKPVHKKDLLAQLPAPVKIA